MRRGQSRGQSSAGTQAGSKNNDKKPCKLCGAGVGSREPQSLVTMLACMHAGQKHRLQNAEPNVERRSSRRAAESVERRTEAM